MTDPGPLRRRRRAACARWLIRWCSRTIEASYSAWCRVDRGEVPDWWIRPWAAISRRVNAFAMPLAHRLDSDAATRQMVEECWWG